MGKFIHSEVPENLEVMLLGDGYDKEIFLKLYDPVGHRVYTWRNRLPHAPYCYIKPEDGNSVDEAVDFSVNKELVKRFNSILDKEVNVLKATCASPLDIGGSEDSLANKFECWEANIRYVDSYLIDQQLIVGTYYRRVGEKLVPIPKPVPVEIQGKMKKMLWDRVKPEDRANVIEWATLLNQPVPDYKMLAVDIEVLVEKEGQVPSYKDPKSVITAVGLQGSDGFRRVLVLKVPSKEAEGVEYPQEAVLFDKESDMLKQAFSTMRLYPVILTFNGDEFDLPYLYTRATGLGIPKEEIPIHINNRLLQPEPDMDIAEEEEKKSKFVDTIFVKHGIHIDLYRIFKNVSLQNYAFNQKYKEHSLEAVAQGLLKKGKSKYEGALKDLTMQALATYCLNDSALTLELATYGGSVVMKLLTMICRVAKVMSMEDIARHGVNQWIRACIINEHRKRGELVPTLKELESKGTSSTVAIIKDKKYRGAEVMQPVPGVHWKVVTLDFSSLYPSIVKNHNLSHETINCPHESCKDNKVPLTSHWVCTKRRGIVSLMIGSLRDLRVNYYKPLSKDKSLSQEDRAFYSVIEQAIKVILNSSYGVMGFKEGKLYCLPVADAVTAIGRYTIQKTIEKCKEIGIKVVYSDTDSVLCVNPQRELVNQAIAWAFDTMKVDLEIDKEFRWVAMSDLKKNYFCVKDDDTYIAAGLTGRKGNTPPFIRNLFKVCAGTFALVKTPAEFEAVQNAVKKLIVERHKELMANKIDYNEMTYNNALKKRVEHYGRPKAARVVKKKSKAGTESAKFLTLDTQGQTEGLIVGVPQHARAAKMLVDAGYEIKAGDHVSFIKTKDGPKPLQLLKPGKEDVDLDKYEEAMEHTMDQFLAPFGMKLDTIVDRKKEKQMTLQVDELGFS